MEQQRIRLKLAEDARKRYQGLADQDYIAREQLFQKEAELSEQQSRLQALERDALVAQRELATTLREISKTPACVTPTRTACLSAAYPPPSRS
jgi:membrane fusion protein